MNDIEELFNKYTINEKLNENFEVKVYSKIRKKKRIKKVTYSFISVLLIFSALFTYNLLIKGTAQPESLTKKSIIKEEIPLIEDVVFASFDNKTYYTIEQVSYKENENDI